MQPPLVRPNPPFVAFQSSALATRWSFRMSSRGGELSFAVWLTVKGVNVARWQEMATRPTS